MGLQMWDHYLAILTLVATTYLKQCSILYHTPEVFTCIVQGI
jgi:hypothetical protein